jgi:23S rRNA (cytidine1920-2'-O)/16S rRNA (cytidine1409-2'-O)-methyltransferase
VLDVAGAAWELGFGVAGVAQSPLPGPSGNVEFFLWLRRGPATVTDDDITDAVFRKVGLAEESGLDEKVEP